MSKIYKDPYGFEYQRDLLSFLEDVEIESVSSQMPEIISYSESIGNELKKEEEVFIELGAKRKDLYFNENEPSKEIKHFLFKKKKKEVKEEINEEINITTTVDEHIQPTTKIHNNFKITNAKFSLEQLKTLNIRYNHNYTQKRTTTNISNKVRYNRGKFLQSPLTVKLNKFNRVNSLSLEVLEGKKLVSKQYTQPKFKFASNISNTRQDLKVYLKTKLSNVKLSKSIGYLEMITMKNYIGNKKLNIMEIYLDDKEMIDIFFNQNINLVWKCVQKINYQDKEDLFQVASIGMYDAIKKFDKTKGVKFSTLGYQKINAAIFRYLENHSRAIRLPSHIYQRKMKISKAKSELEKLNKEIDLDSLSKATKLSKKDIEFIEKNSLDTVSMFNQTDSSSSEKEGELASTVHFSVEDYSEQVCKDIHNSQVRNKLYKIFKEYLNEIEMNVLIKTFYEQKSPKEISLELNLDHTKVSQIKNKTLRVLKKILPSKGITLSSLY